MSNIKEQIRQEIERRKKICEGIFERESDTYYQGKAVAYGELLNYINSHPEEIPPCQTGFKGHTDPVGRRGRQGMVPRWISEKAEEYQKQMEPPYDSDDIISAYESGAMWMKERTIKDAEEDALLLERAWLTLDGFGHEELAERLRQFAERKGLIWK